MRLLILGGNSDIALATARVFAREERADVVLASRDMEVLEKRAADIRLRYRVRAESVYFDACDYESHPAFYAGMTPKPDGVVLAFGTYAEQSDVGDDFEKGRQLIDTNFTGAVSILGIVASDFERRGHGFIIGIGSVAGLRGRQSNYLYGASKAGLGVYLAGLRNRLSKCGVHVMTVLPGFVRTKMTEALDLPGALTASPEDVAADIYRGFCKRKNTIYSKWFWRIIMGMIRATPEPIFKRLTM